LPALLNECGNIRQPESIIQPLLDSGLEFFREFICLSLRPAYPERVRDLRRAHLVLFIERDNPDALAFLPCIDFDLVFHFPLPPGYNISQALGFVKSFLKKNELFSPINTSAYGDLGVETIPDPGLIPPEPITPLNATNREPICGLFSPSECSSMAIPEKTANTAILGVWANSDKLGHICSGELAA
jgi:hypothetical protein